MWHLLAQHAPDSGFRGVIDDLARTPLSKVVIFVAVCTVLRLALYPVLMKTQPHLRGAGFGVARFLNEALDAIIYAGVFVFLIIRPFFVQAFLIPSGSMVPTLLVNDFIVANKAIYRYSEPKVGDIVVFRPPLRALTDRSQIEDGQAKVDFIKRLVGTPGQVIEIRNNVLFRNGVLQKEPHKHFTITFDQVTFREMTEDEKRDVPPVDFKLVEYEGKVMPVLMLGEEINSQGFHMPEEYVAKDAAMAQRLRELPPAKVPPGHYLMMGDNRNNSHDGRAWGLITRDAIIGRSEAIWLPLARISRTR